MNATLTPESLYLRLPLPLQNLAVSVEGARLMRRRYGAAYPRVAAEVEQRQWLRGEALEAYQRSRLGRFLREAARTPFWRERFSAYGVRLRGADPLVELRRLPVLTRAEAKAHVAELRNPTIPEGNQHTCHTSGTTGSGLVFWESLDAERERWANWWRYRGWHGISLRTWCGYFGGRSLVPLTQKRPPFWRVNRPGRQLMFSAYHLSRDTAREYVDACREHAVPWLHGYPSVLALLAGYMLDQGIPALPALRVVTTGAENLLPHQHELIARAFGVPVVQHYGQSEAVANFSGCESGRLHVDEDYALVEFIPLEGKGAQHRIVGTNWTNPAFPLLRYEVGDLATLSPEPCACGRPGRVVAEVDGRQEDYVTLPSGARVGRLDHIFKDLVHVREAQIFQDASGNVVLRVVKGDHYDANREEARLLREVRQRLGNEIALRVEYHRQLSRAPSGKLRFVVSDFEAR